MPTIPREAVEALVHVVGASFVHMAPEVRATYECDACVLIKHPPDLVVLPNTTEEVAQVVQICHQYKIPFIPRGAGTGLSGGALAVEGGIMLGLNRMNRILSIDTVNQIAVVETGVVNAWLNQEAQQYGLFYAPDPSSQSACTIGGNIAENAGGVHCFKYGMTVDHVLGLEVVTPQGEIVELGGPHGLHSAVNWVGVFTGSEGTFGIATKAMVRLLPMPGAVKVFVGAFPTLEDATDTVASIIAQGLKPSAIECMDDFTMKAVNEAFDVGFPESSEAVLLVELDGTLKEVASAEKRLIPLFEKHHVQQLKAAEELEGRQALWRARKLAVAAYGRILPAFYLHDCVVPRSQLTPLIRQIKAIAKKHDVLVGNVFHAGDGNLHPNMLLDPNDPDMIERVLKAGDEMLKACLAVGGVLSGEHGIGLEKQNYMDSQYSQEELAVMRRLKAVFDPGNMANPAKIFPRKSGCGEAKQGLPHKLVQSGAGWI